MRAAEGNLGHSITRGELDWEALARDKARLGALRAGRVKMLRAVEDQSALIPEERTSELGRIKISRMGSGCLGKGRASTRPGLGG